MSGTQPPPYINTPHRQFLQLSTHLYTKADVEISRAQLSSFYFNFSTNSVFFVYIFCPTFQEGPECGRWDPQREISNIYQ
jgi:hypothetical protein